VNESFRSFVIPDYGMVQVGDRGTIISKNDVPLHPGNQNSKGYFRVHIGKHFYSVHRLVALAFIPNPEGFPQINHLDGNKANNSKENLEWASGSQNVIHAHMNRLSAARLSPQAVREIRQKYAKGGYTYQQLGDEYGVCLSNIGHVIKKRSWNYT